MAKAAIDGASTAISTGAGDVCVGPGQKILVRQYPKTAALGTDRSSLDALTPLRAALGIHLHAATESGIVLNGSEIGRGRP